jgi:hypothetical protein
VILSIIPPYQNSNGVDLEVKGWIYIVIVASTIAASTVYYSLAFGYRQRVVVVPNYVEPTRSIVRWGRAVPRLCESDTHEPQYGVRRWVEIHYESDVSVPCSRRKGNLLTADHRDQVIFIGFSEGQMRIIFQTRR